MSLPKKVSKDYIVKLITDIMLGRRGTNTDGFELFEKQILVVDEAGKRKAYLADENQVLKPLSVEGMAAEILRYVDTIQDASILIDHDLANKIAKTYLIRAIPIDPEDIKLVRAVGDPGYCHFRQPYNLLEDVSYEQFKESCPLFADWLDRIAFNKEGLVHFIGSIFDEDSYNQQYLVLKGSGGDGKGSLLNCLYEFFGPLYAASFMTRIRDKDWTSTTYQKRVVAFPDAQCLRNLNEEVFKSITGGNSVAYRGLYEREFTARTDAKFIICTNEEVDVSGMLSDSRRRIYCEIKPPTGPTPNYQKELIEESQVFFSYCHSEYLKNCARDLPILTDASVEAYLLDNSYDEYEAFFDQYLAPNGSVKRGLVHQLFKHQVSRNGKEFKRFKLYLERVHGVTEVRMDGCRRFKGVCIRSAVRSLTN